MRKLILGAVALTITAGPARAQEDASALAALKPVYRSIGAFHTPAEFASVARALAAQKLETVPTWTHGFSIRKTSYSYTLVGARPGGGQETVIPTIIVPIRLTISDYLVHGKPLVLDATGIDADVEGSPIFYPSFYISGVRQFSDAMLHAEFPDAPRAWSTVLSPSIAPTLDIVVPKGAAKVLRAKSGRLVALIDDDSIIDKPIAKWTRDYSAPESIAIFNTYNALEHDAFGYHSFLNAGQKSQALLYIYNSWFEDLGDVVGFPSPSATTLSHEIAETIHDPLGTSVTRLWGDAFRKNTCFQHYIEVGDAIEDAAPKLQFYDQWGSVGGKPKLFVLQSEALLPWFERQTPSHAQDGAYSFPGNQALTRAAPLDCVKR